MSDYVKFLQSVFSNDYVNCHVFKPNQNCTITFTYVQVFLTQNTSNTKGCDLTGASWGLVGKVVYTYHCKCRNSWDGAPLLSSITWFKEQILLVTVWMMHCCANPLQVAHHLRLTRPALCAITCYKDTTIIHASVNPFN